ncbi:MBL fold metallo-hydrolase [Sorangium sp. So ce281]|uniref:MBL fold metallo-hydrolase n=1 Tax=unclassified Sorangium TaxID=2621164 RepID=UPI003F5FA7F3
MVFVWNEFVRRGSSTATSFVTRWVRGGRRRPESFRCSPSSSSGGLDVDRKLPCRRRAPTKHGVVRSDDHLCATTIAGLARMPAIPIVTSLGVGSHLERLGIAPERIHELDWGESCDVRGLRFLATPSQHYSGRSLSDRDATLWSSWVIQSDRHKVFFSGDTGLTEQFRETGQMYGPFDLVMLEIGAFYPGVEAIPLGPENALKTHRELRLPWTRRRRCVWA